MDGHTPDESTTDATPALTDLQSESFHSPASGDIFPCVSGPLHENISRQTQSSPEPQASCLSARERPLSNLFPHKTKPHSFPQISRRVRSMKVDSPRGALRKLKLRLRGSFDLPAFTLRNVRHWSPASFLCSSLENAIMLFSGHAVPCQGG